MQLSSLFILVILSFIPPLSPDEQLAVSRIKDDTPFIASSSLDILINHIKTWPGKSINLDNLPALPFSDLQNNPRQYHGELFLITGKLLRRDKNPLNRKDLEIWIILPDSPKNNTTAESATTLALLLPVTSFDDNQFTRLPVSISVPARFFARLTVPDNSDNHTKISLPLFIGSFPQLAAPPPQISTVNTRNTIIIAFLLSAASIWIIIRILTARSRKKRNRTTILHPTYDEQTTPSPPLPEEPAEALHILREHSQPNS